MVTVIFDRKSFSVTQDNGTSHNEGIVREVRCLSTDTKPITVPNGTECIEIDTGDVYIFDAASKIWNKL